MSRGKSQIQNGLEKSNRRPSDRRRCRCFALFFSAGRLSFLSALPFSFAHRPGLSRLRFVAGAAPIASRKCQSRFCIKSFVGFSVACPANFFHASGSRPTEFSRKQNMALGRMLRFDSFRSCQKFARVVLAKKK